MHGDAAGEVVEETASALERGSKGKQANVENNHVVT